MTRRGWLILVPNMSYRLLPDVVVFGSKRDAESYATEMWGDDWRVVRATVEYEAPRRSPSPSVPHTKE